MEVPAFIGDDIGGMYDWNLSTVPQIYLDGLPRSLPQGRVLGGGTVLNGMLWNRGGMGETTTYCGDMEGSMMWAD